MRDSGAHFPGVVFAFNIEGITVLIVVHNFTEVVIGVAGANLLTGQSDVVEVEFGHGRGGNGDSSELTDHGAQEGNSKNRAVLAEFKHEASDHCISAGHEALLPGVVRVALVLVEWVNPAISYRNSVRSDNLDFSMVQVVGDGRDVMPRETLSSQVELSVPELRVLFVEAEEELVEIVSHLVLRDAMVHDGVGETEASAEGLVNEHDVRIVVPRLSVVGKDSTVLHISLVVLEVVRA